LQEPLSTDKKYLTFTWNTTDFKSSYIQIKLNFDKPFYVSHQTKDTL